MAHAAELQKENGLLGNDLDEGPEDEALPKESYESKESLGAKGHGSFKTRTLF